MEEPVCFADLLLECSDGQCWLRVAASSEKTKTEQRQLVPLLPRKVSFKSSASDSGRGAKTIGSLLLLCVEVEKWPA